MLAACLLGPLAAAAAWWTVERDRGAPARAAASGPDASDGTGVVAPDATKPRVLFLSPHPDHWVRGDPAEALRRINERFSRSEVARSIPWQNMMRGLVAEHVGQPETAIESYQVVVDRGKGRMRREGEIRLGRVLASTGRLDEAEVILRGVQRPGVDTVYDAAENYEWLLAMAVLEAQHGDANACEDYIHQAERVQPLEHHDQHRGWAEQLMVRVRLSVRDTLQGRGPQVNDGTGTIERPTRQ
ncbi:MAG: tetratricopeptide repeat protein [Planctomycetota bacterium]|nr:tetratricopeptide repeat protein [Planctomycetota bacterium]